MNKPLVVRATATKRARFCGDAFALRPGTMALEPVLTYSRTESEAADRGESAQVGSFGFAFHGRTGDVYNEEAFRHFLGVERTRATRSDRSFLLLLVSLRRCPAQGFKVPRTMSTSLFDGLGLCVREVDFIGWYRDQRVAGAVLAQGFDEPGTDAPARIVERVTKILSQRLPSPIAGRLRVRIVQLGRRAT